MIIRFLFRFVASLTLVFAACIGLIHAQRYDDSELRAFLSPPDGCPMPCFMGIRPGVTTVEEAVAILERHEWVGETNISYDNSGHRVQVLWSWSGLQPDFIVPVIPGFVSGEDNIANTISIGSAIPFSDILLIIGKPDQGNVGASGYPFGVVQYTGYLSRSLVVQITTLCPLELKRILQTPVTLAYSSDIEAQFHDDYHLMDWMKVQPCS